MIFRLVLAKVLEKVFWNGRSLDVALQTYEESIKKQELGILKAISYGAVSRYRTLEELETFLLRKPLKNKDRMVRYLLWAGLYQLAFIRKKDIYVITETVEASKKLRQPWATAFLNANLRQFLDKREKLLCKVKLHFDHPDWMIDQMVQDWPSDWQRILNENNKESPMHLRVNRQKISRENYVKYLSETEIQFLMPSSVESGVTLLKSMPVIKLPYFSEGYISIQDLSAQCVVPLLELMPGSKVLDACSAPGGKATHIMEFESECDLTAVDIDENRLLKVQQNLDRLGLTAELCCADITELSWWQNRHFDRILLDVPCSGSGVIRRHPDIKVLRRADDIDTLSKRQLLMLERAWSCLDSGGILVYSTCSLFKAENDAVIKKFLGQQENAELKSCDLIGWIKTEFGYHHLPTSQSGDGFFVTKLIKINS